ncbi:MAG: SCO family protein [Proteobacteria bacterium]|nr:SCO family protein [Pseudomonadota bacterium]
MAVLIAALSAVGGVAFWNLTQARSQSSFSSLLVLPHARVIADFRLTDHHSQPFSLTDLRGKWSLIFFGFVNCPDVCPGTLFELQKVNETLQQALQAATDQPQILFISVDPERDTPAKLEQYLSYFDPEFIGITGDQLQLMPLTLQLGIAYRIEEHDPGTPQYDVAHSASILLTDPEGRLYGVFPAPHDAEKISADLLAVIEG